MLNNLNSFFRGIFSIERFLIFLSVVLFCFFLEIVVIGWKYSSLRKLVSFESDSLKNDFFSYIFKLTNFIQLLAVFFSFGLSLVIPEYLGVAKVNLLEIYIPNIFLQNVVFILILDFILYWTHRGLHFFAPLWELHKFHHSATEMTVMTTARLHPMEIAINSILFSIPIFLIGVPLESYVFFFILTSWLGHIQHSNIPWTFGFIGEWIFISPITHKIHHSINEKHFNKNFGTITPLWDRIFCTWEKSSTNENIEIGLDENIFNEKNVLRNYFGCIRNLFKNI
ncbi:sterol desaturase family protein [Flavobacterium sp. LHD-85]|uniref:sterol desaturase family protein n=1 Tax=Flavobacterium sp. LHD-85 TaxID=3071410 RepID=UPI0027E08437|nr:sterol desaturase family protein [Flavobacterium sp. LHD-85]MDQ6531226.1 sterol desaturase family protein [Flavobacterium sp. LHD-85]